MKALFSKVAPLAKVWKCGIPPHPLPKVFSLDFFPVARV
jgi:hypothetical protein